MMVQYGKLDCIRFREGTIVVDTYDRYTEENDFSRALIKTPICFPKKKRCIGNPAGIGKGTGFGLRERDRDGIGLGHYRLRANSVGVKTCGTYVLV